MQKKRSVGVRVVAIAMLIYGILCLIICIWQKHFYSLFHYGIDDAKDMIGLLAFLFCHHQLLDGMVYLIASVFILTFKNWARKFTVISSIILFLFTLPTAIYGLIDSAYLRPQLILYTLIIFFFTRPKVKEQFR